MTNTRNDGAALARPEGPALGGLYDPRFERGNCGWGMLTQMDDRPSHRLVSTAISSLSRLSHRGAIAADGKSGDGCGLLLKKPRAFLQNVASDLGFELAALYAVGTVFLSRDSATGDASRDAVDRCLADAGLKPLGWREVPLDTSVCGISALATLPRIEQVFVNAPLEMRDEEFERKLFVARRRAEMARNAKDAEFYVTSLSARTLSYKGLVLAKNLPVFYSDLQREDLSSSLAIFHQRFSTNTFPQWRLAQPFRILAHNGEINTIAANRNWALARAPKMRSRLLPELAELTPIISADGSDSMSLDNMLEVLLAGGMDMFRAMRLLVPPAWQNVDHLHPDLRAFYEYQRQHMEPWDGPAGIVLTDGRHAACVMDRNGLRPARWVMTRDRTITLASEVGVWDYAPSDVEMKGRLKPGEMLAADTATGELLMPSDIDKRLMARQPYRDWVKAGKRQLTSTLKSEPLSTRPFDADKLKAFEKFFEVTNEERDQVLRVLAESGQEAVGSMGDDTPLPVLSSHVRSLFDNFRQQFAQVTNPPIDPLREQIVMSLETSFARETNPFEEGPNTVSRYVANSPVLSQDKFRQLTTLRESTFQTVVIDLCRAVGVGLRDAVEQVCEDAVAAVKDGKLIIVLSDRGLTREQLPVHALLATGAVHHRLIAEGLRTDCNLVVESGVARDPHQIAVLIGYGASAVYPYLAYEVLHDMTRSGMKSGLIHDGAGAGVAYRRGIVKGLHKILSKMGISTIASYRGAQLYEAVGVHSEVVDLCFKGTVSRIEGINFDDLDHDRRQLAWNAFNPKKPLDQGGLLKYVHGAEYHAYNPDVVNTLQAAVASGDYADYETFADTVNNRPPVALRDLMDVRDDLVPVPLDSVEPAELLFKRFDSAGMSLGALSPEAHETLAMAMNSLGGRSNSGEGGEDPSRYGTNRTSKIKQVASGRFGVTPHYLVNAEVLQIKVAQGAKPGEGGQLPGHKVNELIARLRYSRPGVSLISPPPHHDIYSIEDLAQLIFDLKQVNPEALVSVKLVAEAGVGTIAAGVAKAYADLITIAGYDGGTGASPLTSVKYAGSPWELGLTETHQTLRGNDLRSRVRVQTDGGLKTGLDVIKAAILGAESFGFGTGPMVAMGCKYLRICHLNNCATGVATQNVTLRTKHFKPDGVRKVENYFRFIAEDTRRRMAALGVTKLEDLIGRTDLLKRAEGGTDRQQRLNLDPLLNDYGVSPDKPQFCTEPRNEPYDKGELAEKMIGEMREAIVARAGGEFVYRIRNCDRSIGARISGEIARHHGDHGMADYPVTMRLTGTAGQSFGVWNAGGLHMYLEGDANDYTGKGMAGGKIVINPPRPSRFKTHETVIIGNTCLYGATGGKLYASGIAGERFAVRNSGALTVVEGCGDHGCEYMTGGVVVVLGKTGLNFGAGMTGGLAFVLDEDRSFVDRYNHELIDIHRINSEQMEAHAHYLVSMLNDFVDETGSPFANSLLEDIDEMLPKFWLVKPKAAEMKALLETLREAA